MKVFVISLVLLAMVLSCNSTQLLQLPIVGCVSHLTSVVNVGSILGGNLEVQCARLVAFEKCVLHQVRGLVSGVLDNLLHGLLGGCLDGLLTTLIEHQALIVLGVCKTVTGLLDNIIHVLSHTGSHLLNIFQLIVNDAPSPCATKVMKKCLAKRATSTAMSIGGLCGDCQSYYKCIEVEAKLCSCTAPIITHLIKAIHSIASPLACLVANLLKTLTDVLSGVLGVLG